MTNFDTFQIFVLYAQTTEISKIPGYKPLKTTIMEVFLEIYMYSIEKNLSHLESLNVNMITENKP